MDKSVISTFDERRDIALPGDSTQTLHWAVEQFIDCANEALEARKRFTVALSGGSTPKAIYQQLANAANRGRIDWSRAWIFWSDERSVPPTDPDSNYKMAMDAGFAKLPIPAHQIFRMEAEGDIAAAAQRYESLLLKQVPGGSLDLVMLGMGEDGHIASLFPNTHGLNAQNRHVIANYVPQKNTWRMTFTFDQINSGRNIALYVLGQSKAPVLSDVLLGPYDPARLPAQRVGTQERKALWIVDKDASAGLNGHK